MSGYPMAWEAATSMDRLPKTCPYSIAEKEEYLFVNHYHWARDEAPTTFTVSGRFAQKVEAERRYWLFDATKDRLVGRKEVWCPLCQKQHVLEPLHDYQADNPDRAPLVDAGRQLQWFIVVGTGNGCFDSSNKMRRWMYAETNDDGLSPDQFLEKAYHEQLAADARS
jgi:hypothetical protein